MLSPPLVPPAIIIPENAPFTADQRAWLSGYFAALLIQEPATAATALTSGEAAQITNGPALASNDDAPWHDPSMALPDRMTLAEGKAAPSRLMAAMAQQDCGQCGYNCADYANAIFLKKEERLNLCAPGGKETARKVKELFAELGGEPASGSTSLASETAHAPLGEKGRCRENPTEAVLIERRRLNGEKSEKHTYHIEFDLSQSGVDYEVGDAFGVLPVNDLGLVDQIIAMLGVAHTTEINGKRLRDILAEDAALGAAPDKLFELISYVTGGASRAKAQALARGEDPDGDAANLDVLAALMKFPGVRPHPEAFVEALDPLQPRLYSISSSPKADKGRLSLTIDAVRYRIGSRKRVGVASTHLGERADIGARVKVYVQKAHNFALPSDMSKPVIMVGPGTGVAPFRAFLREREAVKASGANWLFFGHQRQESDFFYRDELEAMKERGALNRLSLAWSRDGAQKFYVQDRMREVGADLWRWLEDGAHFYICGDAKRMAKDVESALVDIVAEHGKRGKDEAVAYVQSLKKTQRYQADVY
ncbi:sulfite reductase subunit alpha [Terrarubrum flagellatum]|uniref:sulfite reductase subunit alpha n=1 Tax=Terrirubrum flagellatum TaxID=2895980 RepID=UPI003144E255